MQLIAWFDLLTFIHWIVIYLVESDIQPLNNWGQVCKGDVFSVLLGIKNLPYFSVRSFILTGDFIEERKKKTHLNLGDKKTAVLVRIWQ